MTTFRLEKQPRGKTSTRFFVYDDKDSIVGTINVPNEATADLENHWKAAPASSSPKNAASARKQNPAVAAMVASARKRGPISKEAILRGC